MKAQCQRCEMWLNTILEHPEMKKTLDSEIINHNGKTYCITCYKKIVRYEGLK